MESKKRAEWALRIGIFGMFLGHGVFALMIKKTWIPYLTIVGFSEPTAMMLMQIIGALDIIIGLIILIKPMKWLLTWAAIWAFATALIRPIAGEPIWDFVERWANWAAPLALIYFLKGTKKKK